ncbi:hypothetical protein B1207_12210 [Legionella quinlivanii]|uniref:DUF3540 domain-containing protein n=1 Tax=Legionella quinlivanii TaxID=45073 RepID=A0A364LGV4_9GAMM|nr:DUF3540 domain-containing protein [Legionella quinlivanii]RAP35461.1 hypothetical protein B1207_12210 [Legionella quinlivanii]
MLKENEIMRLAGTGGCYPATIKFIEGDNFHLKFSFSNSTIKAKKAFSCLLEPLADDEIMAYLGEEEVYVLAILNRRSENHACINMQHGLEVNASSIGLNSTELAINSEKARLNLQHSRLEGQECSFHFERLKFIAKTIEKICDTLNLQTIRLFQWVEDLEHQVLGRLRSRVKKNYRLDCGELTIITEDDAKIKAKQIHLG